MSTPTDSVAPAPPTGTSNPWPLVQWWKRICDWIAALSPSGVDKYDTGWVDITVASGFTGGAGAAAPQVRRIGREVKFKGAITGPLTTTATTIGTVPAGFRPTDVSNATVPTAHGNASVGWGQVNAGGEIRVRLASGSATTATLLFAFSGYTVD